MFDLTQQPNCLLCRQPIHRHDKMQRQNCETALDLALKFLTEYYCGLAEKYNFDVMLSVRGAKLVQVGPKKPKLKHVDVC